MATTPSNSINQSTTGVVGFNGTAFSASAVTQYAVLVGSSTSSSIANVSPSTAGQVLTSNGASANPSFQNYPSGFFPVTDVTGATQDCSVNNGYVTNRSGGVVYTLPSTATEGDVIKFIGKTGIATITPNTGQQIVTGAASGLAGATGTSTGNNAGDCMELMCITGGASAVWRTTSMIGTWNLVTS